jgi:hypothetical protein
MRARPTRLEQIVWELRLGSYPGRPHRGPRALAAHLLSALAVLRSRIARIGSLPRLQLSLKGKACPPRRVVRIKDRKNVDPQLLTLAWGRSGRVFPRRALATSRSRFGSAGRSGQRNGWHTKSSAPRFALPLFRILHSSEKFPVPSGREFCRKSPKVMVISSAVA